MATGTTKPLEGIVRRRVGGPTVAPVKKLGSEDGKSTTASTDSSPRQLTEKEHGSPLASDQEEESPTFSATELVHRLQLRAGDGDCACGPSRYITLNSSDALPRFCCKVPALILFSMMTFVLVTYFCMPNVFYVMCSVLCLISCSWSSWLAFSSVVGARRMRRDCQKNWAQALKKHQAAHPGDSDVTHFVILPNYKECEEMMWHTIQNLAQSSIAKESVHIVLAMEDREVGARAKAERLMERARPHFADVVATFHPAGLPNELAGKSSNEQWAYREVLRLYGCKLARMDPSRVFLTVGDADTLFHPQYLEALSFKALKMSAQERSWSFWQPPVMLMRNLLSVPGPTRVSAYATIMFELGGNATKAMGPHLCFSSYSTTLALASHPLVNGWDKDVIAEDHHMFAKSYFASLWEASDMAVSSGSTKDVVPKVKLQAVYMPALGYLVDAGDTNTFRGWMQSVAARTQQAERHAMGVAELGYLLLQYVKLCQATGFWKIPYVTHRDIGLMMLKMMMVHIVNQVQACTIILTTSFIVLETARWILAGGLFVLLQQLSTQGLYDTVAAQTFGSIGSTALACIFGPMGPYSVFLTYCIFSVMRDLQEGRLTYNCEAKVSSDSSEPVPVAPDVEGSQLGAPGQVAQMSFRDRCSLFMLVWSDFLNWAQVSLFCLGFFPCIKASWSLLTRGTKFEYVVAAKPS